MSLNALYVYSAELFPTRARHRLLAACSTLGRLGAILAPLTPLLVRASASNNRVAPDAAVVSAELRVPGVAAMVGADGAVRRTASAERGAHAAGARHAAPAAARLVRRPRHAL